MDKLQKHLTESLFSQIRFRIRNETQYKTWLGSFMGLAVLILAVTVGLKIGLRQQVLEQRSRDTSTVSMNGIVEVFLQSGMDTANWSVSAWCVDGMSGGSEIAKTNTVSCSSCFNLSSCAIAPNAQEAVVRVQMLNNEDANSRDSKSRLGIRYTRLVLDPITVTESNQTQQYNIHLLHCRTQLRIPVLRTSTLARWLFSESAAYGTALSSPLYQESNTSIANDCTKSYAQIRFTNAGKIFSYASEPIQVLQILCVMVVVYFIISQALNLLFLRRYTLKMMYISIAASTNQQRNSQHLSESNMRVVIYCCLCEPPKFLEQFFIECSSAFRQGKNLLHFESFQRKIAKIDWANLGKYPLEGWRFNELRTQICEQDKQLLARSSLQNQQSRLLRSAYLPELMISKSMHC